MIDKLVLIKFTNDPEFKAIQDKINELVDAYNKLEADYDTHYHHVVKGRNDTTYPRDDTRGHG